MQRQLLAVAALATALTVGTSVAAQPASNPLNGMKYWAQVKDLTPPSADSDPESLVLALMTKYKLPGGQVCVARKGRIVYSHTFGYGDEANSQPVHEDYLFRIASTSKMITAVAIWQLIEEGKLSPQDHAFEILADLQPSPGSKPDERLKTITISQLLEHASGFSLKGGDPQFTLVRAAADQFHEPRPASPSAIIRMRIGEPMDFEPGTRSIYCNFNFNVLGRIIEHVSGMKYADYVKTNVLAPAGVSDMELGRTRFQNRLPKEVWYSGSGEGRSWSVLDDEPYQVTAPYGGEFAMESCDAHGGWVGSAQDLVRIVSSVDGNPIGKGSKRVLKRETRDRMLTPTKFNAGPHGAVRGEGVILRPSEKMWGHSGALPGSSSIVYTKEGTSIAAIFNYLPYFPGNTAFSIQYTHDLDDLITALFTHYSKH